MNPPEGQFPSLQDLARGAAPRDGMRMLPFWWDAAAPPSGPWTAVPSRVDVLIIGAGFTGLAAALTLARRGRQIIVVDADVPGFGASGGQDHRMRHGRDRPTCHARTHG